MRALGGDYQSYMGSPVRACAVFAMSVVLVAAWIVSLPFLLVRAGIAKLRAPQRAP